MRIVEDGEYGTGDCNAKMADWLFEEFGQQGHRFRAGQFRLLAEREDESGMIVVGKGTIKRIDHQDVDDQGQPYDLILPGSPLKGNSPGKYVRDTTHLGLNAWSERRRVKFSLYYRLLKKVRQLPRQRFQVQALVTHLPGQLDHVIPLSLPPEVHQKATGGQFGEPGWAVFSLQISAHLHFKDPGPQVLGCIVGVVYVLEVFLRGDADL